MPGVNSRKGQANVITLMILISVTIVLALLLYSYFSGAYVSQSEVEAMIRRQSEVATSLKINVEAFSNSTNLTVTGGLYIYCGMATITNYGGQPLAVALTLLPGAQSATGIFAPDAAISRFPIDYASSPPGIGLYAWLVLDYDHDGIMDMLAGPPDGPYTRVLGNIASCMDIYRNTTLKRPENALRTTPVYATEVILDPPTGLKMLEVIKQVYPAANESFVIPSYQLTLDPGETVSIYFYAQSPVALHMLTMVVLAPYNDIYLAGMYVPIWNEG